MGELMTVRGFTNFGGMFWPDPLTEANGAPSYATSGLDAVNEKVTLQFISPFTGNIRNIGVGIGGVGGSQDWILDARVETLGANGNPTDAFGQFLSRTG